MHKHIVALLIGLVVLMSGALANDVANVSPCLVVNTQEANGNSGSSVTQIASNTISASSVTGSNSNVVASNDQQADANSGSSITQSADNSVTASSATGSNSNVVASNISKRMLILAAQSPRVQTTPLLQAVAVI
jgi:hypothetical protein